MADPGASRLGRWPFLHPTRKSLNHKGLGGKPCVGGKSGVGASTCARARLHTYAYSHTFASLIPMTQSSP